MKAWETLARETVWDGGRFLKVEQHTVRLPDGRVIDDWAWAVTPDYACILPVLEDGRFLLFRQRKYAIDGLTLALPGGYLEPGEKPEAGARRELEEETGCRADRWVSLGAFAVDANRGAGTANLFLALGARPAVPVCRDDLEAIETVVMDRRALESAWAGKAFKALAWTALVGLGLAALDAGAAGSGASR